jgi:hypothetical protein
MSFTPDKFPQFCGDVLIDSLDTTAQLKWFLDNIAFKALENITTPWKTHKKIRYWHLKDYLQVLKECLSNPDPDAFVSNETAQGFVRILKKFFIKKQPGSGEQYKPPHDGLPQAKLFHNNFADEIKQLGGVFVWQNEQVRWVTDQAMVTMAYQKQAPGPFFKQPFLEIMDNYQPLDIPLQYKPTFVYKSESQIITEKIFIPSTEELSVLLTDPTFSNIYDQLSLQTRRFLGRTFRWRGDDLAASNIKVSLLAFDPTQTTPEAAPAAPAAAAAPEAPAPEAAVESAAEMLLEEPLSEDEIIRLLAVPEAGAAAPEAPLEAGAAAPEAGAPEELFSPFNVLVGDSMRLEESVHTMELDDLTWQQAMGMLPQSREYQESGQGLNLPQISMFTPGSPQPEAGGARPLKRTRYEWEHGPARDPYRVLSGAEWLFEPEKK